MRRDGVIIAALAGLALAGLGVFVAVAVEAGNDPAAALSPWLAATRSGVLKGALVFVAAVGATIAIGAADCVRIVHGAVFAAGAVLAVALGALTGDGSLALPPVLVNGGAALAAALIAAGLLGHAGARAGSKGRIWSRLGFAVAFFAGLSGALAWAIDTLGDPDPAIPGPVATETVVFSVAVGILVILRVVAGTPTGLAVRAATEDRTLLSADGHRVGWAGTIAILAGLALAIVGLGLWLFSPLSPDMGATTTAATLHLLVVAGVVVAGGIGSVRGCALAALLIVLTGAYAEALVPGTERIGQLAGFVFLVALRPHGVLPVPRMA